MNRDVKKLHYICSNENQYVQSYFCQRNREKKFDYR